MGTAKATGLKNGFVIIPAGFLSEIAGGLLLLGKP
jgi:hypothetical protein